MKCVKETSSKCHFEELKVGDCFFIAKGQEQLPMIKLPPLIKHEKIGKVNAFSPLTNELWYFHSTYPITPLPDAEFHY